jgi:ribosomal protein S12 methylthiotransferase accessory factor YcaO
MPQALSHVRSVSLGSSASQFLQSLKLQDPAAFQHSLLADQLALPDQHTPHAGAGAGADPTAAAALADAVQDRGGAQSARSKRAHRGSNGRTSSKDAMQLDNDLTEQQPHGFTPLPAVVENSAMDSER